MINFRYHVVSLIAVFLALAIGVIMGSAVIDRAIVNRLEDQQRSLEKRITGVETENDALVAENRALKETADALSEQGSQRLLTDSLTDVPVFVIATRGSESGGFDDLVSILGSSGADERGVLWLTDRFTLDSDDEIRDLTAALSAPSTLSVGALRRLALTRLATMLRDAAGPLVINDPSVPTTTTTSTTAPPDAAVDVPRVFVALRDAGFLDFDAPEGQADDIGPQLVQGTRLIFVSGGASDVKVDEVSVPFVEQLVVDRAGVPAVGLLAAEEIVGDQTLTPDFVDALRKDDAVSGRLSTIDNLGDFAGRLASVLAISDLGLGRVGHYGTGPGAQRLLPAPPEGP
jgi:hypothetical protein